MVKKGFPAVHFYDQDFVDLYEQTWAWVQDAWYKNKQQSSNGLSSAFLLHPDNNVVHQFEACLSTFFLAYSNRIFPGAPNLDNFYQKQEDSGAIRGAYRVEDGAPIFTDDNPEGVEPPLFAFAEYNLFHKGGNKKRLKEVVPVLQRYSTWLEETFKKSNGLYAVPLEATRMDNSPRDGVYYPVDFNTQLAINALYMSALGDILNDKEMSFTYKRHFFSLKTRINSMMWDEETGFYYDLNEEQEPVKVKTIAAFWTLLAEIPNEAKASSLINHLKDPHTFGVEHPFPTLAANEPAYDENGSGCRGSVYPAFNFMIIKGLEKYARYELAREAAIRHLYYVLDTLHPEGREEGNVWEAYLPTKEGPARWEENEDFPQPLYLAYVGLSTITLMIENVLGLFISLPRKTVDWIMPNLEIMGIENLSLKRNIISILTNKSNRGWEVRLESEKLYYFTINILEENKKKTLPIPSGKCSMLIEKM
jgi:neutral trehalase